MTCYGESRLVEIPDWIHKSQQTQQAVDKEGASDSREKAGKVNNNIYSQLPSVRVSIYKWTLRHQNVESGVPAEIVSLGSDAVLEPGGGTGYLGHEGIHNVAPCEAGYEYCM